MRTQRRALAIGTALLLALGACGQAVDKQRDPELPTDPTTEEPTDPATEECAPYTARAALQRWLGDVPTTGTLGEGEVFEWDEDGADLDNYDPCAPLSWILITMKDPPSIAPYHIMLFSRGEFVGTATDFAFGFWPDVRRLMPDEIAATYSFMAEGDSGSAGPGGRTTVTYRWDDDSDSVKVTGELPPRYEHGWDLEDPPDNGDDPGDNGHDPGDSDAGDWPYSGTNWPPPPGSTQVSTVLTFDYSDPVAILMTPSRNIMCDIYSDSAGCGILSYGENSPYGTDEYLGAKWWVPIDPEGDDFIYARGDPPLVMLTEIEAQIVPYESTVYYGNYACTSLQEGLTCWNMMTGNGAKMNRQEVVIFRDGTGISG